MSDVTGAQIVALVYRVQRVELNPSVAELVAGQINGGATTLEAYTQGRIAAAKNSTRPAILVSQYFEGMVPLASTLDLRASFCQTQYNSYLQAGANADLGPYEALGKAFADTPSINAKVTGKSLAQIITEAYQVALATNPSTAQVNHFESQYNSFYNLYVGAGIPTATADLHAKGAMIGQILGWGGSNLATTFSGRATAWLNAAATGQDYYGVPLA